ncbi:ORF49 [Human alphaherpesvirus 3]
MRKMLNPDKRSNKNIKSWLVTVNVCFIAWGFTSTTHATPTHCLIARITAHPRGPFHMLSHFHRRSRSLVMGNLCGENFYVQVLLFVCIPVPARVLFLRHRRTDCVSVDDTHMHASI